MPFSRSLSLTVLLALSLPAAAGDLLEKKEYAPATKGQAITILSSLTVRPLDSGNG